MRKFRQTRLTLFAAGVVASTASIAGCAGGTDRQPDYPDPTVVDRPTEDLDLPEVRETSGDEEEGAAESEEPPPPVRVVRADRTPLDGNAPTVRIVAPRAGQTIRRGNVSLRLRVTDWPLAPAPGQHMHVIVDDEPYIAVRDVSAPIDLNALVEENLGHELAEGTHTVRVFPSRAHHESVKSDAAFAMVRFNYRRRTDAPGPEADAPLLTYSRPRGCNPANSRILLDFFISDAELGSDGHRVLYTLDGSVEGVIDGWVPHWIENLGVGDHSLRLRLVDAAGETLPGPFNDVNRTFRVAEACE